MKQFRRMVGAFTLVEMLTVIFIIAVLAAILIPATQAAMRRAKIAAASADISRLSQAAQAYNLDFGAFPPDQRPVNTSDANAALPDPFPANLNPNECLVWYLTRSYSADSDAMALTLSDSWRSPTTTFKVGSRTVGGPYLELKASQKRDYYSPVPAGSTADPRAGYLNFTDPWGRPYMYRAYPISGDVSNMTPNNGSSVTVTLTLTPPTGISFNGLANTLGNVQLTGFVPATLNGVYAFQGAADNRISVTLSSVPNGATLGQYQFPLHNQQSCDVYSLGPNGRTRAGSQLSSGEWKPNYSYAGPVDTVVEWVSLWGTPGDGNDIEQNGNYVIKRKRPR